MVMNMMITLAINPKNKLLVIFESKFVNMLEESNITALIFKLNKSLYLVIKF